MGYDTAPTIDGGILEPVGATSYVTTTDAPQDPTSVVFDYNSGLWMLTTPSFATVADLTIYGITVKLFSGDMYCMSDPGSYYEGVVLSVTFYDGAIASVQRALNVAQWSVVDQSCDEFNNMAKEHMGGMTMASCKPVTLDTSEQYGADLVTGQTWQ